MADLPANVRAWFPPSPKSPQATGVFVLPEAAPKNWHQYHHLLADRVQWMLENGDPDDLHLAIEQLEENGLLDEPVMSQDELLEAVRNGSLQSQLSQLGVQFPGKLEQPTFLKDVGLLEWASSLSESPLEPQMPQQKPSSKSPTRRPAAENPSGR